MRVPIDILRRKGDYRSGSQVELVADGDMYHEEAKFAVEDGGASGWARCASYQIPFLQLSRGASWGLIEWKRVQVFIAVYSYTLEHCQPAGGKSSLVIGHSL